MACLKRLLDGQDPDYEDSTPNEAKRLRLLEQNAKADVSQKVCSIVECEFNKELASKEKESIKIQERLHQAQKTLHLLRYAIVRNYYTRNEVQQSNQQTRIHPAVKKLIGKQPQYPFWGNLEQRPSKYRQVNSSIPSTSCLKSEPVSTESADQTSTSKTCDGTESSDQDTASSETKITKVPRYIPPKPDSNKIQPQIGLSRGLRHKVKKRLVIGNISKWIPVDVREDCASHKWMIYVRGPREAPDISGFVSKVRFFLHPSFRPNDVVEVTSPPFHLSRRGWGEFPVRVQVHFNHPMNKPVDLLHHLKLDNSYTGLQRLGAETVVDIWLYVIPTSINCTQGESDGCKEETESTAVGSTEIDIWNVSSGEEASCRMKRNSSYGNSSKEIGLLPGAATARAVSSSVEIDGHFTVAESQISSGSFKNENVGIKEESGIESCGSSDVSEPPVCKTELNACEEGASSRTVASNFDYNITIKEEPMYSDVETDCTNAVANAFNTSRIKEEDVTEEIQVDGILENGTEMYDKPEFFSTMFDHDYFSCVDPLKPVDKVVATENAGEEQTTSSCNGNYSNVPFSVMNGIQEHSSSYFAETKANSMDNNFLDYDPVDCPVNNMNDISEIIDNDQSNSINSCLQDSPKKQDVQKVDVAKKPTTLVKCMDASGNIFYITLAGTCAKPDQDAPQPAKPTIPNSQLSFFTKTSCETVTVTSTTVTTVGLYSGTNVSQSSAARGQDNSPRSVSVVNSITCPGTAVSNKTAQHVINISTQESKTVMSSSLLPPLDVAKNLSDNKNLQVAYSSLKGAQIGKGLLNVVPTSASQYSSEKKVVPTSASQYSSAKKVVLVSSASSVMSSIGAKQSQHTLLTSSAGVRAVSTGVQPKPSQTVLLLRDGQYYVLKQESPSPSKSLLTVPERESSQTSARLAQQPGIIFKMPAAGGGGGVPNGSARLECLPVSTAAFQAKPGCSLLKKKVRCAQSPPPLSPIARPAQLHAPKVKPAEDVKPAKSVDLPVVPVIKKVERKMIVLNRTHGPITAATSSRASHYEERLKAAVDACKFPTQTLCVRWLLRHLPLVCSRVSDHNFRTIHPYAAPSHEAFLEWNIGKQRAAEWLRAKKVQKYLLKLCYSEDNVWSTRAIAMWARHHGYTPVTLCGINTGCKMGDLSFATTDNKSTYSEPVQIMEWLETNCNSSLSTDDDVEIDVVDLDLPVRAAKQSEAVEQGDEAARVEVMEHDRLGEADCMFVREKVRELGFKMSSEQIMPGVVYCAAERVLLEAMKSLAEDLLRRAHCKAWIRNSNRPPETVTAADVMEALLGRSEFDIFSNFGLGVQAADTG